MWFHPCQDFGNVIACFLSFMRNSYDFGPLLACCVWSAISLLKYSIGFLHKFALCEGVFSAYVEPWLGLPVFHYIQHRLWLLFSRWNATNGQIVFIILAHDSFRTNTSCTVCDIPELMPATLDSLSSNLLFLSMNLSMSSKPSKNKNKNQLNSEVTK
jgi:hypothetical protein